LIPIYSISKPFLAEAVLALALPLSDTIGQHLPRLAPVYAQRTIGDLLNHRSGLDDYGRLPDYHAAVANNEPAWSRGDLLERCAGLPHANPGFEYSNIGYLLLRMLLEQETGLSYFQAIRQLVLEPLNISGFREWESATDVVPGYDPSWVYSGTFLGQPETIAANLTKLAIHRRETIGHSAGWKPVPYQNTGFDDPGYNYGFMADGNPARSVGHGGGGPGFGLMALVNLATGQAALRYSAGDKFDQAAAICDLRTELGL